MSVEASKQEYIPIVAQCAAQNGNVESLPSLEAEYGHGWWHCDPGPLRADGKIRHRLIWTSYDAGIRRKTNHTIGAFYLKSQRVPSKKDKQRNKESLLVGYAEDGCPLIRVISNGTNSACFIMKVITEIVRGEPLPRPIPYQEVQR